MVGNTTMVPTSSFTDSEQLLRDETAIFNCFTVSAHLLVISRAWILSVLYFVVSQDMLPSVVPAPPNIQFQLPYALPSETQMGTPSIEYLYTTRGPYFALENALNPFSAVLPQTTTTSHDNSVRNCIYRFPCSPI